MIDRDKDKDVPPADQTGQGDGRHEVDPPEERVDDETPAEDSKRTHRQE